MPQSQVRASLELVFSASIWGFGFIASIWALPHFGPLWMTVIRFGLGSLLGFMIMRRFKVSKEALKLGLLPGLFLAATLGLQTWGLLYTSATNSGFLTTLYVMFVPFAQLVLFRKRVPGLHYALVAIALLGTAMICSFHELSNLNLGDMLTIGCAVAAALHLLTVEKMARALPASPLLLNSIQSGIAGLILIPVAISIDPIFPLTTTQLFEVSGKAWFGLAFLTFASSMIAFLIQIRAQRVLNAGVASLICLLESPFAAYFGWLILSESITPLKITGGVLILAAATAAILWEQRPTPSLASTT